MSASQAFLTAGVAIGLFAAYSVLVIAVVKLHRGRADIRSKALLAPYRGALVAIACGEDVDGQARTALHSAPAAIWDRLRSSVLALIPKVRGVGADDLGKLLRSHGDVEQATRMLTSWSAVRRARAAYLLGLVGDPDSVVLLLPLLSDPGPDVRRVAARALGAIGDPSAATEVLQKVGAGQGQIGLPAWVVAEALLAMGVTIAPALWLGLDSEDASTRNVCALVAGQGTFISTTPRLRNLLSTDVDDDVRVSAAVALGRIGGADDAAILARHARASEPTALRRTCTTALGELGHRESLDTLVGLLDDGDRRLAQLAADAAVRIGAEGVAKLGSIATGQSPRARVARAALDLAELRRPLPISAGQS